MRTYDLYYQQRRINSVPLSKEELKQVKQMKDIRYKDEHGNLKQVPVNRLQAIEVITF